MAVFATIYKLLFQPQTSNLKLSNLKLNTFFSLPR
jgi:hypothetical protein